MSEKIVSVLDFGAVPGSDEFQDTCIQKAIDECFLAGGGEVRIPAGIFRVRTIRLRSNVTLRLCENAHLEASRNPEDYFMLKYDTAEPVASKDLDESAWERVGGAANSFHIPGSRWNNGVIRCLWAKNVAIIGEPGSVIDGRDCFDEIGEENYRGPHAISILHCENVTLRGYTVVNSANWAQSIKDTKHILVENVENRAGHDGVHITSCEDVTIRGSRFYTGDDCIAGYNNKDILVEDCQINTACSAFRFSGTNVLVQRCNIFAPAKYLFRGSLTVEEKRSGINANDAENTTHRYNMLSLFTYFAEPATIIENPGTNIVIRDCTVDGADRFLHYNYSGNEIWQSGRPMLDIAFENIRAVNISMPLTAYGDPDERVKLWLRNVDASFREGAEAEAFMKAANFEIIAMEDVTIRGLSGKPLMKCWGDPEKGNAVFKNVCCDIPREMWMQYTDEKFICKPI